MTPSSEEPLKQSLKEPPQELPLFPLGLVLYPGAQLALKVFEARYLDLMGECMRNATPFGVVCLSEGAEVGQNGSPLKIEAVGVLAALNEVDAEQPGILRVQCSGGQRFRIAGEPQQRSNGLWVAGVTLVAPDPSRPPGTAMEQTVTALAEAIQTLQEQDRMPFAQPYRLDDAGWVANRWCELLPISLAAKQKLMELEDPVIRLSLVDGFLRDKKVIIG
ncbi:MAG: LON peptidase substrate-binding domain-containing protein [Pseudomonadota bacterium]|nr:LON peptidase substrate-binding domain-containing protein [Pseudomonadota bacterium]